MGADGGIEAESFESTRYIVFVETGRKVFGQPLARLGKSRFQKRFELRVVKGAALDDLQNRRHHFGRGNERVGRHVEKEPHFAAAPCQHGQRGEGFPARLRAELFRHLFLHHHQQTRTVRVPECAQNDVGRNVIGEIGNQVVRPAFQTLSVPVTQNISAPQFQPAVFDGCRKTSAQMLTKVSVHLISGDTLFLDQISGQIT